jgi:hypothetical protein
MTSDCHEPVTHIDRKGYVYCKAHGVGRRDTMPCRPLRRYEIDTLSAGGTVPWEGGRPETRLKTQESRTAAAALQEALEARDARRQRDLYEVLSDACNQRFDTLSDEQFELLCKGIAHSTIPEALGDLLFAITGESEEDD